MGLENTQCSDADVPLRPLALSPNLERHYHEFLESFDAHPGLSLRWLELIGTRISYIHDQPRPQSEELLPHEVAALAQGNYEDFSEDEQALLAVVEQMPFAVHQISDADIARLSERLDPEAVVVVLTAIAFVDVNCRLAKCWQQEANDV